MNEETEQTESAGPESVTDESRYEVKWKKKESSGTRQATDVTTDTAAATGVEELRRQLEESDQRATDLHDRWQRAAADLVNLRKRTEQDRGDMEKFASMMLVAELLPVLDNFERAMATVPGNLSMLTWIQGVMLIERHVRAILEHQGLAAIEADGQPFNPHLHEALGERETDAATPGTIVQVYQKGYTMHGRVIRPALVELARAPEAGAGPIDSETTDEQVQDITDEAEKHNAGP